MNTPRDGDGGSDELDREGQVLELLEHFRLEDRMLEYLQSGIAEVDVYMRIFRDFLNAARDEGIEMVSTDAKILCERMSVSEHFGNPELKEVLLFSGLQEVTYWFCAIRDSGEENVDDELARIALECTGEQLSEMKTKDRMRTVRDKYYAQIDAHPEMTGKRQTDLRAIFTEGHSVQLLTYQNSKRSAAFVLDQIKLLVQRAQRISVPRSDLFTAHSAKIFGPILRLHYDVIVAELLPGNHAVPPSHEDIMMAAWRNAVH